MFHRSVWSREALRLSQSCSPTHRRGLQEVMSGITSDDVAKMFLFKIQFILLALYIQVNDKALLSLTEVKGQDLKLVAEAHT